MEDLLWDEAVGMGIGMDIEGLRKKWEGAERVEVPGGVCSKWRGVLEWN